jgi:translation initiation factor 3 subunit A
MTALNSVISSKRHRTWSRVMESVMQRFVELGTDALKSKEVKEALYQYRFVCQSNPESLELVCERLVSKAEAQTLDASASVSLAASLSDASSSAPAVDSSYEAALLASVSGLSTEQQLESHAASPRIKFLWEAYRSVLEVVKNVPELSPLYHKIARRALRFGEKHDRRVEFRRLCEVLRTHVTLAGQRAVGSQPSHLVIGPASSEAVVQAHLETRFDQLEVASNLEMWQEAFKAIEDISEMMHRSGTRAKVQLMATYYEKLAQIFWVSSNYLFHAYAYYRFYSLCRTFKKSLTQAEIAPMASKLLLATLAIPPAAARAGEADGGSDGLSAPDADDGAGDAATEQMLEYDAQKDKNQRMATLLGFAVPLRRDALLAEILSKRVLADASPDAVAVYAAFNDTQRPLTFCDTVKQRLAAVAGSASLACYVPHLESLMVVRLLQQLASIYEVMRIAELERLTRGTAFAAVEARVVDYVRNGLLELRIDHRHGVLRFGARSLESAALRNQLRDLCARLTAAERLVVPGAAADLAAKAAKRTEALVGGLAAEHESLLARKQLIERRKEADEFERTENEAAAAKADADATAKREADDAARLAADLAKREAKKRHDDEKDRVLRATTDWAQSVLGDEEREMKNSAAADVEEKMRKLNEQRKEMRDRLTKEFERAQYYDRACRAQEAPLLAEAWKTKEAAQIATAKANADAELEQLKKKHADMLVLRDRLRSAQAAVAPIFARLDAAADEAHKEALEKREKELRELSAHVRRKVRLAREAAETRAQQEKAEAERRERRERDEAESNRQRRPAPPADDRGDRDRGAGSEAYRPPARRGEGGDRPRDDRPRDDRPRDDRPRDDRPRDDRSFRDGPRDGPRDDRFRSGDRFRDDRPRDDRPRDDRPRDDRPRDDRPRDDRPRDDRPRDDRPRDDRPRDGGAWRPSSDSGFQTVRGKK